MGPLSISDIVSYFHVKLAKGRYMLYKRARKIHIYFFPNKTKYAYIMAYENDGPYTAGHLALEYTKPNFSSNLNVLNYLYSLPYFCELASYFLLFFVDLKKLNKDKR